MNFSDPREKVARSIIPSILSVGCRQCLNAKLVDPFCINFNSIVVILCTNIKIFTVDITLPK